MTGATRFAALVVALSVVGATSPFSTCSPARAVEVAIVEPAAGEPAFGRVVFEAEVYPTGDSAVVEMKLDGRVVARLDSPPYRLTVDLGDDNTGHRFEAVARGADGSESRSEVVTAPVPVHLEVDAALQQLYVTLTRDGERLTRVDRRRFTVLDDGSAQEIVTFSGGEVPFTAMILIDSSASMEGDRLAAAVGGARHFVASLAPLDEAMVALFSDRLLRWTPWTDSTEVLDGSLVGARAVGGTSLNDHLYLALRLLEERQGRRLIVVFTDGRDVTSVLDEEPLLAAARASSAMVYWIRLGGDPRELTVRSAWRDGDGHRRQVEALERVVRMTGGRIVPLARPEGAAEAFSEILAEIREQVAIGFYPSVDRNDGRWHPIEVRVDLPGVEVRGRHGYLDRR